MEEVLQDGDFFRIHHSYCINMKFVQSYIRGEGGEVVLNNGIHLPVSRTKKKDFLTIGFNRHDNKSNKINKSKNSKDESYPINHSVYSSQDLNTLNNIILMKNSSIKVSDDVKNLTNKIYTQSNK